MFLVLLFEAKKTPHLGQAVYRQRYELSTSRMEVRSDTDQVTQLDDRSVV